MFMHIKDMSSNSVPQLRPSWPHLTQYIDQLHQRNLWYNILGRFEHLDPPLEGVPVLVVLSPSAAASAQRLSAAFWLCSRRCFSHWCCRAVLPASPALLLYWQLCYQPLQLGWGVDNTPPCSSTGTLGASSGVCNIPKDIKDVLHLLY